MLNERVLAYCLLPGVARGYCIFALNIKLHTLINTCSGSRQLYDIVVRTFAIKCYCIIIICECLHLPENRSRHIATQNNMIVLFC
uniref:Uncharacterized protein n=1 Tax=Rhipicephalus microplus TaxID=6941 RepID=A0A6M2DDX4_RHIMP